ncbi:MAG: amidohydrolase family protein [Spirochaetes bacterium]|nr:amidohydrolase family protein [Spirochaetota bacterium]MBU1082191.1 amidohydrolase family protein [Spirochaetota bacterium]
MRLDTLIAGGSIVDPIAGTLLKANVGFAGGRVAYLGREAPEAARVVDAAGLFVSPGFVDTHMHDEELDDLYTIQRALLLQGVTTAIAGNCGSGPLMEAYKPKRQAPMLKLAYQTGHTALRKAVGIDDAYRPATAAEIARMQGLLRGELERGSFGLSFGLEYAPNTSPAEIDALASLLSGLPERWISVHIRYDGPRCLEGVREVIDIARRFKVRVQVSHIGSMTAFGYCAEAVGLVEAAKAEGLDMSFDCYPYDAFCTHIGSAVFDPGFEERWQKGLSDLEAASGKHKGARLTPESYADLRANDPEALVIAHVMNGEEIRTCLAHPSCAVASDGVLHDGQGHPRAAGTFPRALRILREAGLSWPEAVRHATSLPASMAWLDSGALAMGSPADAVVFDPEALRDKATFADQLAPPEGIAYVFVDGAMAVDHGTCAAEPAGRLLFKGTADAR